MFIYRGVKMNYYNEIKETFVKNEIYKKAKDYSKTTLETSMGQRRNIEADSLNLSTDSVV